MRKMSYFIMAALFMAGTGGAFAATPPFTTKATLPTATSVLYVVHQGWQDPVTGDPVMDENEWTSSTLDYGTMTFDSTFNTWNPPFWYAIDVKAANGTGTLTTTASYADPAANGTGNPNPTPEGGLGYRSTIKFVKEVFTSSTTPPAETAFLFKAMNAISGGVTIAPASFAGGWLRMYVGVYDGLEDDILGPPQGTVSQFTALDKPGEYTGVLTLNTVIS